MNHKKNLSSWIRTATFISTLGLALTICGASAGKLFAAAADSLDQLYEKAKKEGKITLYAPLSPNAMSVIPPAFMKRFPGVTVDHIDATSDKLITRVLAEQKGGRVIADVISGALTYLPQILDLKIVEQVVIPEAAAYPAQLKGDLWVATDTQFYVAGWNTNLVKKGEEPKSYEDIANPKWKDSIMGEPRDFQVLVGFAKRKYNNDVPLGRSAPHLFYLLLTPFSCAHEKRRPDSTANDGRCGRSRRLCNGNEGSPASQCRTTLGSLGRQ